MKKFLSEHKHFLWFLYVPIYLIGFFGIEKIITNEHAFWSTVLPIDTYIPFWEWAVFAYSLWYPFMLFMAIYLAATDKRAFSRYMCYMAIGFTTSLVFCLVVPNGTSADFRPAIDELGRSNVATWLLENVIWKNDTYTNVMPSIHIVGTFMVVFGFHDSKLNKNGYVAAAVYFIAVLITASTVLTKQHTVLDVIGGTVYSILLYVIVYVFCRKIADKKYEQNNTTV